MDEDGMDSCECLWNHELSMRRLLSLLRQAQSYCTDNICLDENPGQPSANESGNNFLIMFLMMAMAVVMYVMRPQRADLSEPSKPVNPRDSDGSPPNPPAIN